MILPLKPTFCSVNTKRGERLSNNHLGRNPIFSSPKPSIFSEAELLHNWFDFISGEMEGALAPFGEACSGSLVFFSPPGQDSTL